MNTSAFLNSSLSHVTLLVSSVEASAQVLNSKGIQTCEPETFESEGTKEIYVGSYNEQKGLLLLIEAISAGPYQKALKKRGPSLHHIAIDVLNVKEAIVQAQNEGWELHPITEETLKHKTAWLFSKQAQTLLEVHQKSKLSEKPMKISNIFLPLEKTAFKLFQGIGLGSYISEGPEISFVIDGQKMSFSQIACVE